MVEVVKVHLNPNSVYFTSEVEKFIFITCGGAQNASLDFTGLISAYDTPTWICIIAFFVGINSIQFNSVVLLRTIMYNMITSSRCFQHKVTFEVISQKILRE